MPAPVPPLGRFIQRNDAAMSAFDLNRISGSSFEAAGSRDLFN